MTMTEEILQTMWENNVSSGKEYIDGNVLKSIIQKYDSSGYSKFEPDFSRFYGE